MLVEVCVFVLRRCSSRWSAAVRAPRSCGSASWSWHGTEIPVQQVSELATHFLTRFSLIPISRVFCRGAAAAGTGEEAPGGCSRWGPETSTRWFSGTEGSRSGRRARGSSKAVLSGKQVDTHIQTVCTDQIRFACGRFSQSPSLRLSRRETPYWDSPRLIFCRRGRRSEARWRRQRGRPFLLEGWRLICREPRKRKGRGRKNAPHSKHRCFSSENNWRRLMPPAETRVTQSRTPVELSWWIAMMWIIVNVLKKWEKKHRVYKNNTLST